MLLTGNALTRFRTRSGRPLKRSLTGLLCKLMKGTLISSLDNRHSFRNTCSPLVITTLALEMERTDNECSYGIQHRTCCMSVINADNARVPAIMQNSNTGVLKYYYFGLKIGASHIQGQNRPFRYSVSQRCTVALSGTEQPL